MTTETLETGNVPRETSAAAPECSKCGEVLDTTGFPKWCRKCRKKYNEDYRALSKEMSETRGFAAGVSAAKAFLASEFEAKIRGASISGYEAARLVRVCNTSGLTA